jgi:membrane protease YdiL (CAAX protease family)
VIHLNPWQAIGAFTAGLFLGWIYWKTRSLTACIFIHAVNNGTAYFIQLLNPELPAGCTYKDFLDMHMPGCYWIVFVIFAFLLAAILLYLNKRLTGTLYE